MKILQVNKYFYLRGGAERYLFEISHVLRNLGHDVIPFSMHDQRNEETPYAGYFVSGIDFFEPMPWLSKLRIIPRVLYSFEARKKIEQLIERTRPEIAHLHNIYHQISPSILHPLRSHGIPVVQTLHDYKLICPTYQLMAGGQVCERCKGHRYVHAAMQKCNRGSFSASMLNALEMYLHHVMGIYHLVDLWISPSLFLKKKCIEFGIPGEKIVHLPNFLRQHPDGESILDEQPGRYAFYFGRLSAEKGLPTLIRAMKGIPDLELRIAGEGPIGDQLRHMVDLEQIRNVSFLGYLKGEQLNRTLRKARFVVLPSEWYENNPYSILEAFAMGKPVIGSRIGGIPELVCDGKTGYTFQPGDIDDLRKKMVTLSQDGTGLIEMGHRCCQLIRDQHNEQIHTGTLMTLYHKLLA